MVIITSKQKCTEINLTKKAEDYDVLFATGIVNPNGPTVNVVYYDYDPDTHSAKLICVNIHPTSDSIREVGSAIWSGSGRVLEYIEFYSDFFNGSMPSLFIKGKFYSEHLFNGIIEKYITNCDGSLRTYRFMKEYEGKPFKRVTAEINSALDLFSKEKQVKKQSFFQRIFGSEPKNIEKIDVDDFIKILTKEKNVFPEIQALFMAYNGSIENVIPPGMVQITFKEFVHIFTHVAIQCHLDLSKILKQ